MAPFFYSHNENQRFEVLGEVFYEGTYSFNTGKRVDVLGNVVYDTTVGSNVGFLELLKTARKLYPDCDYVIDIMADSREVTSTSITRLGSYVSNPSVDIKITYSMRGTAIRYIR